MKDFHQLTSLINKWVGEFGREEVILELKNELFRLERDQEREEIAREHVYTDVQDQFRTESEEL